MSECPHCASPSGGTSITHPCAGRGTALITGQLIDLTPAYIPALSFAALKARVEALEGALEKIATYRLQGVRDSVHVSNMQAIARAALGGGA